MTSLIYFKFNLHPAIVLLLCPLSRLPQNPKTLNEKQSMSLLFQMLLAGRVTLHAVTAAFWELGVAQGFTAEVIRQHVVLKVHDKSIWQSHTCCLHKLTPASGYAGSRYQLTPRALSLLAAEQKLPGGLQDQNKTDARKSCQINGTGSKLDNII